MQERVNQARKQIVKEIAMSSLATSVLFNSLRAFSYANREGSFENFIGNPTGTFLSYLVPASMLMCLGYSVYNRALSHVFADDISANKIFFYSAASIYGITSLINSIYHANSPMSTNLLFPMCLATILVTGKEVAQKIMHDYDFANQNRDLVRARA